MTTQFTHLNKYERSQSLLNIMTSIHLTFVLIFFLLQKWTETVRIVAILSTLLFSTMFVYHLYHFTQLDMHLTANNCKRNIKNNWKRLSIYTIGTIILSGYIIQNVLTTQILPLTISVITVLWLLSELIKYTIKPRFAVIENHPEIMVKEKYSGSKALTADDLENMNNKEKAAVMTILDDDDD